MQNSVTGPRRLNLLLMIQDPGYSPSAETGFKVQRYTAWGEIKV